ncbi:CHAD domain-containing protein [Arthrobacter sp. zg-Y1219]|uniref:CHAD domain-containing protein n=1 Tax=Arthrobacter sp. zg-Y1219 TaxID=3049067 RepID=UPI0024C38727|nr:CHAD domain-containing protein [Arthrobacter sp. zg-Y1219]MDK1361839.1 CHAD domain-containing protein [Arthrobacter sp. zg-Y1219]
MPTAQDPEISVRPPRRSRPAGEPEPSQEQSSPDIPAQTPTPHIPIPSPASLARQIAGRVAGGNSAPLTPEGPAGLLLLAYLRGQFLAMLAEDPRVRADRADAVHKMRVSTRRMRSALASYQRVLAPEPARTVRNELKWLAGVLGAARDAQVLRARLHALVNEQPAELVMGPVLQRIDEELLGDYAAAHAAVAGELDGVRYRRLLEQLEAVVTRPDFTAAAEAPAAVTAGRMLQRDRKRLHQQVRDARSARSDDHRAQALHDARKDAKRLRYAAEVAQPVRADDVTVLIAGAEHVQKILGEHQDSVVSREYLRRLGAGAADPGQNGFTFGRLHALEEERGETARKQFRKAWATFPRVA